MSSIDDAVTAVKNIVIAINNLAKTLSSSFASLTGNNAFTGTNTFLNTVTMTGAAFNEAFATIASAATTNIGAAAGNYLQVTGVTTITAFGTVQAGTERTLEFAGILTLTHNATSLILPGGASIVTAAGDTAIFRSEGSGNWRCISYSLAAGPLTGMRNRLINGAMRIDQRNVGGAVTPVASAYTLDRWQLGVTQASKLTVQQVTAPTGFIGFDKAAKVTVAVNYASLAADAFFWKQTVEGNNISDLAWGSAAAKTVVLSFWAQASVTGTYGLGLRNNASNRAYTAQYTISAANTPTFIVIVIPGDTSGTWLTDSNIGIELDWDLGSGTNFEGVANTWQAGSALMRVAGNVSFVANAAATWQISGVQLEAEPFATAFERRQFGLELALCQRYYETGTWLLLAAAGSATPVGASVAFKATKRATPTLVGTPSALSNVTGGTVDVPAVDAFRAWFTATGVSSNSGTIAWTAAAEL